MVQHGCDGSPTEQIEFQVPADVTGVTTLDTAGWTGSVDGRVVTYRGGSLPDDEEGTFGIGFTAPDAVGTILFFPVIQTCEDGSIDWVQTEAGADRPAPQVEVIAADPNAPVPTTEPAAGDDATATSEPAATTEPTSTSTTLPVDADPDAAADEESEDSTRAYVIAGMVALVAVGGVVAAWLVRRREDA